MEAGIQLHTALEGRLPRLAAVPLCPRVAGAKARGASVE